MTLIPDQFGPSDSGSAAATLPGALAGGVDHKGDALALNRKGIEYGVLGREVESNRQIYESLLQRVRETGISGELKTSNIRIVDAAEIPRSPAKPRKQMNLLLALVAGGMLGAGLAFFFEYLHNRIKSPEMAEQFRLAGFVPDAEIPITFIGPRPGEKLYEELFGEDETAAPSHIEKIMRVQPVRLPDREALAGQVAHIEELAREGDTAGVLDELGTIVPTLRHGRAHAAETPAPPVADLAPVDAAAASNAHSALVEHGQECQMCGSIDIHRSHMRSRYEHVRKSFSHRRPYRCHGCGWRGWLVPMAHHTAGAPVAIEDALGVPDLDAIDASVGTRPASSRPAFSPRALRLP